MKLLKLTSTQINELLEFNKIIFPDRTNVKEHFQFLYVENPLVQDKSNPHGLLTLNDSNQIIGQFMLTPAEFYFNGQLSKCFFGCDYYVLKDYRHSGAGALLAMKAINGYKPYFTIGASEDAKKISLSLKTKYIGDLNKFIKVKNIFTPFKILLRKITGQKIHGKSTTKNFPETIKVDAHSFKLLRSINKWDYQFTDKKYIEFSRTLEFIKWRFLSRPDTYYFYQMEGTNCFFVCRELFWHGLNLLALVDFRASTKESTDFSLILKATQKIMSTTRLDGLLTMSSLSFFDRILQKNGFIKIGKPQPVLTNAPVEIPPQQIENRSIIYATMADCDIELNI